MTRLDIKAESIYLLHTRNRPQSQRQTWPQSKGMGKNFQSNVPKKQTGVKISVRKDDDVFRNNYSISAHWKKD